MQKEEERRQSRRITQRMLGGHRKSKDKVVRQGSQGRETQDRDEHGKETFASIIFCLQTFNVEIISGSSKGGLT